MEPSYLDRFILDCKAKGMTPHSIETYQSNVAEFLAYNPIPCEVSTDHLRSYLERLRRRHLSPSTLKGYISAISSFYEFLVFEKELQTNPVPPFRKRYLDRIKIHPESRQLLSVAEMRSIFKAARNKLERAVIMIFAKTGIRRGEFHDLKLSDLDFKKHIIHIPQKAKRSNNIVFMDNELETVLLEYLSWRQDKTRTDYLWISRRGRRIHKDAPGMILADLGRDLNLHQDNGLLCRKLTPHCFRHWFTTHLFRAGMNHQYIKFLRGDSLRKESWQLYNRIDIELVRTAYLRYIPQLLSEQYIQTQLLNRDF